MVRKTSDAAASANPKSFVGIRHILSKFRRPSTGPWTGHHGGNGKNAETPYTELLLLPVDASKSNPLTQFMFVAET